ncbi:hypothetical protein GTW69_07415 [Streptomyces sp. SID7760]|nr:hypothetical protein [Streptomyces sp. SID7760]
MVSFRALARRLVEDGIVPTMSHQRLSKIAATDPDFPPVVPVGSSKAVDYRLALPYFRARKVRPGERTDLKSREGK